MIATEQIAGYLAQDVLNFLKADGVAFLREVRHLGRKLETGAIQIIGTEVYAGPDGSAAPYAYMRYRDGSKDHTYTATKGTTSEPHFRVRAALRMVIVHRCKSVGALQTAALAAMMKSEISRGGLFQVEVQGSSASGVTILPEETKEGAEFLGEADLLAFDFDLTYLLSSGESECNFTCNACC